MRCRRAAGTTQPVLSSSGSVTRSVRIGIMLGRLSALGLPAFGGAAVRFCSPISGDRVGQRSHPLFANNLGALDGARAAPQGEPRPEIELGQVPGPPVDKDRNLRVVL